jgi:ABC-2 type transport system permease protein
MISITIFNYEFRERIRSVITWALSVTLLIFVYTALFPSFAEEAELMKQLLANFPPELLAAFGMTGIDLTTVMGYFSFIFLFVQVALAVQAAHYGFDLVSVEEREMTADFLLSKPVTRSQVLTAKLAAALAGLALTQAVIWAACFGLINLFRGDRAYDPGLMALILAGLIPFQLFFLMVGVAVSLLLRRVRSVTFYALALALGMYFFGAFSDITGDVKLENLTPFKHFDANYVVHHGRYDLSLVAISLVVIVVATLASYRLYLRRDIPTTA